MKRAAGTEATLQKGENFVQDHETKTKKQRRAKTTASEPVDTDQGINPAIGKMDRHLLADFVAQSTSRFGKDLSLVELEDNYVPGPRYSKLPS